MKQKLSELMPNAVLDINELANIKGGTETPEDFNRVCDTAACSSNLTTLVEHCTQAICRTGA